MEGSVFMALLYKETPSWLKRNCPLTFSLTLLCEILTTRKSYLIFIILAISFYLEYNYLILRLLWLINL